MPHSAIWQKFWGANFYMPMTSNFPSTKI
jgi:hypothetical protein